MAGGRLWAGRPPLQTARNPRGLARKSWLSWARRSRQPPASEYQPWRGARHGECVVGCSCYACCVVLLDLDLLDEEDPFEIEGQAAHLFKHALLGITDICEMWVSAPLFYPAGESLARTYREDR